LTGSTDEGHQETQQPSRRPARRRGTARIGLSAEELIHRHDEEPPDQLKIANAIAGFDLVNIVVLGLGLRARWMALRASVLSGPFRLYQCRLVAEEPYQLRRPRR